MDHRHNGKVGKVKCACVIWTLYALEFLSCYGWIGFGKLLAAQGLVVELTIVLVGVSVNTAEDTVASAMEPSQPHLLVASPAPIGGLLALRCLGRLRNDGSGSSSRG